MLALLTTLLLLYLAHQSSSMSIRKAAIAQMCSTSDKLANLAAVAKCAKIAKTKGASMLFLPECFGFLGESSSETVRNAEPPLTSQVEDDETMNAELRSFLQSIVHSSEEPTTEPIESFRSDGTSTANWSLMEGLQTIARETKLWISGGGLHESGAPPLDNSPRIYNTHVILDETGKLVTYYRKIHLFDVSIPNQITLKESATTAPGSKLVVCKTTPIGNLGLSTCYDVRFPELYVELVQTGGAEVLAVPSAFTVPTGKAHWHALLRARAIECQCYVLAAAQVGRHNGRRESYGHALAVDPWGEIVVDAGGGEGGIEPSVVMCDIDLEKVRNVRERMPVQAHRESVEFSF